MLAKSAIILLFAGACLAYPADEEALPNGPISEALPPQPLPPQPIAASPEDPQGPIPEGAIPLADNPQGPIPLGEIPQGQVPPGAEGVKPENADLKTDNSFWFRRSYYPTFYRRSYYYPRSFKSYYYPTYYSYWPSSWW